MCGASCPVADVGWAQSAGMHLEVSGCVWMSLDVSAALCGMLHSMVAALLRALESTTSAEILGWKYESTSLRIRTPGLLVSWIYHSDIWPYPWFCSWRCTSRCSQSRWLGWEFLPRITTGNTKQLYPKITSPSFNFYPFNSEFSIIFFKNDYKLILLHLHIIVFLKRWDSILDSSVRDTDGLVLISLLHLVPYRHESYPSPLAI